MRGTYSANIYVGSVGNAATMIFLVLPSNKVIEIIYAALTNASNATSAQLQTGLFLVSSLGTAVTVTNVSLTSNVATLTTSTAHGFSTGNYVLIESLCNQEFNGLYQIASTPSSTTFTYNLIDSDVSSTSDNGTATQLPVADPVTVTPLDNGSAATAVSAFGPVTSAEPTYDSIALHQEGWNNLLGYRYQPFQDSRALIGASQVVGLRLLTNPPTSFNAVAEIVYREIG